MSDIFAVLAGTVAPVLQTADHNRDDTFAVLNGTVAPVLQTTIVMTPWLCLLLLLLLYCRPQRG